RAETPKQIQQTGVGGTRRPVPSTSGTNGRQADGNALRVASGTRAISDRLAAPRDSPAGERGQRAYRRATRADTRPRAGARATERPSHQPTAAPYRDVALLPPGCLVGLGQ